MKKTLISLGVLLALVSCSKEKPLAPSAGGPAQTQEPSAILVGGGPKFVLVTLWNSGPAKGMCSGHPINCVTLSTEDGVTVKPHLKAILDDVADSGSSELVASAFQEAEMAQLYTPEITAALQTGFYYLAKSYDNDGIATYMAGRTYPVTFDNFQFAVQGRYMESSNP